MVCMCEKGGGYTYKYINKHHKNIHSRLKSDTSDIVIHTNPYLMAGHTKNCNKLLRKDTFSDRSHKMDSCLLDKNISKVLIHL